MIGKLAKTSKGKRYYYACTGCNKSWFSKKARIRHKCGEPPTEKLGDRLERYLTKQGLTQEKYKEIKSAFGLPPTCNCARRKAWLNKVGDYLGINNG